MNRCSRRLYNITYNYCDTFLNALNPISKKYTVTFEYIYEASKKYKYMPYLAPDIRNNVTKHSCEIYADDDIEVEKFIKNFKDNGRCFDCEDVEKCKEK